MHKALQFGYRQGLYHMNYRTVDWVHTKIQGHQDDVGDIGINIDTTGVYTGVRP